MALWQRFLSKTTMRQGYRWMSTIKYTEQHEYVKMGDATTTIGITDFAQNQLGDVVYVDLPSVGDTFDKGDVFGSVESVKAASDIYMPAGGEILEINEQLAESPHLVNEAAMTDGWFIKVQLSTDASSELEELMDESKYQTYCESLDH